MAEPMYYRRNGGIPAPLPFSAFDATGDNWTDLTNNPEGRVACGFAPAPAQPGFDPATQAVRWNAGGEAWIVEALPEPPPPPPPPIPTTISDRQFAQVLALDGVITQDEALAWAARGDLPDDLEDVLLYIPEEGGQRFGARMLLSSATFYERVHPLVPMLGMLLTNPATGDPYDAAALDSLWTRGAVL